MNWSKGRRFADRVSMETVFGQMKTEVAEIIDGKRKQGVSAHGGRNGDNDIDGSSPTTGHHAHDSLFLDSIWED